MKHLAVALFLVLSLSLALTALAGGQHAAKAEWKCNEDIEACLTKSMAKYKAKGWWGVKLDAAEDGTYTIAEVIADSPAQAAGFAAGDQILSVNGVQFNQANKAAMKELKQGLGVGSKVSYVVRRESAKQKLTLTLGEVPTEVMAAWIGYHMMEHHAKPEQLAAK